MGQDVGFLAFVLVLSDYGNVEIRRNNRMYPWLQR
jgi:hypothetical protein